MDIMECTFSDMCSKINDADMILIGIGDEFQYDWDILLQNERYLEIEREIEKSEEYRWVNPFLQKMALEQFPDEHLSQAYGNLKKMIDGKDYFIVSTVMDDCIYQYEFEDKRIVTPCGGFRKMQCDYNCNGQLAEPDYKTYEKAKLYYNKKVRLEELNEPTCDRCGQKLRFNQIGTTKYAEEGYLSQWELYMKWLQKTVNKKVCVIELGVDMKLPTIIRWPFEKIIYYNQKAFLYRIHSTLYQLGEQIGDRGVSIKEKPVNFLSNRFVK